MGTKSSTLAMQAIEADDTKGLQQYFDKKGGYERVNKLFVVGDDETVKKTFLEHAVRSGSLQCVRLLVEKGDADTDINDGVGDTPLHLATHDSRADIASILLKAGDATPDVVDGEHKEPMYYAAKNGDVEMIAVLLESEAEIPYESLNVAADGYKIDVLRLLLPHAGEQLAIALYFAARLSSERLAAFIDAGADLCTQDYNGNTPLHLAVTKVEEANALEAVRSLLCAGADVSMSNKHGDSPLHLAAKEGSDKIVVALLEKGADPNIRNSLQETPLHLAVVRSEAKCCASVENSEVVRKLLEAGADPAAQESTKQDTPFHIAARMGRADEIMALIHSEAKKANPDYPNNCGETPLLLAAKSGNLLAFEVTLRGAVGYVENDQATVDAHLATLEFLVPYLQLSTSSHGSALHEAASMSLTLTRRLLLAFTNE